MTAPFLNSFFCCKPKLNKKIKPFALYNFYSKNYIGKTHYSVIRVDHLKWDTLYRIYIKNKCTIEAY